jgi:hypothetical protein
MARPRKTRRCSISFLRRSALLPSLIVAMTALVSCSGETPAPETNDPPETSLYSTPPESTFANGVLFEWDSTDPNGTVAGYQYQLSVTDETCFLSGGTSGEVQRSIEPACERGSLLPECQQGVNDRLDPGDLLFYRWTAQQVGRPSFSAVCRMGGTSSGCALSMTAARVTRPRPGIVSKSSSTISCQRCNFFRIPTTGSGRAGRSLLSRLGPSTWMPAT